MTKERRLGRGLEALLGGIANRPAAAGLPPHSPETVPFPGVANVPVGNAALDHAPAVPAAPESPVGLKRVSVRDIASNPAQPRQDFDPAEIKSLSDSIAAHGLLQPVVLRRTDAGYELIAGERRLRAAQEAGLIDVPANIIEADDRASAELAIVENLHRKDLGALEKAASFERYLEQYRCTQEELASRLKIDRSTIANLIRLLELPETVKQALRQGRITPGHARALLPLGEERDQTAFCNRIEREGLSVRATESLVQETIDAADAEPLAVVDQQGQRSPTRKPLDEHIAALEQQFRAALGLKVKLSQSSKGRGKLVIHFRNHDEFDRLSEHLCDERIAKAG